MEPSDHFLSEWERLSPLIQQALDRDGNTHSLEDIKKLVLKGDAQFWPAKNSVGVTEMVSTPDCMILNGWLAAGKMDEVLELTKQAATFGKANGCKKMRVSGRKGWERVMKNMDFSFKHITLERIL